MRMSICYTIVVVERSGIIVRQILLCMSISLLLISCNKSSEEKMVDFIVGDIDGDGTEELLLINAVTAEGTLEGIGDYGSHLEIFEEYDIEEDRALPKGEAEYRFDLSGIKPFELQLGDIDGDNQNEIAIQVFKTAKFHQVEVRRPFFYRLGSGNLDPVWLGSRLSRPYEDFILMDIDGDTIDEIIAIEVLEDGSYVLAGYEWKGFGFELRAESKPIQEELSFIKQGIYKETELKLGDQSAEILLESEELKLITK